MGRLNIVLDDKLVKLAKELPGIKTTEDLVQHALRELLCHQHQRELLTLRGQIEWEGDLDEMRQARRF